MKCILENKKLCKVVIQPQELTLSDIRNHSNDSDKDLSSSIEMKEF